MMKLTIALIFAFLTTAVHAEIYNYSCNACDLFTKRGKPPIA